MTNNICSVSKNAIVKNKSDEISNEHKFKIFLLSVMCIAILIVSFIAFLKIENNLQALLVFILGAALDGFIFINGANQAKKENSTSK